MLALVVAVAVLWVLRLRRVGLVVVALALTRLLLLSLVTLTRVVAAVVVRMCLALPRVGLRRLVVPVFSSSVSPTHTQPCSRMV